MLQRVLEQECDEVLLNGLPFISAFRAFNKVVDSCFGVELKAGYKENINEFKRIYLALGITVTPKVLASLGFTKVIFVFVFNILFSRSILPSNTSQNFFSR